MILIPCVPWQDPTIDWVKELLRNDSRKCLILILFFFRLCDQFVVFLSTIQEKISWPSFLCSGVCSLPSFSLLLLLGVLRQPRPFSDKTLNDHFMFLYLLYLSYIYLFSFLFLGSETSKIGSMSKPITHRPSFPSCWIDPRLLWTASDQPLETTLWEWCQFPGSWNACLSSSSSMKKAFFF